MVVTVLAAGGAVPATVGAGGDDDSWNVAHLAALDVPILQGLCLTTSRAQWDSNDDGLSPLDVATQVASSGVRRPDHHSSVLVQGDRRRRADLLRRQSRTLCPGWPGWPCGTPAPNDSRHQKRVAVVFSAYPTKHARIGNAVGLDTPASAVALLQAMREAGYLIDDVPGLEAQDGDALIHALIERGGQEPGLAHRGTAGRKSDSGCPPRCIANWFATLPKALTDKVIEHWGPAPGELFVDQRS